MVGGNSNKFFWLFNLGALLSTIPGWSFGSEKIFLTQGWFLKSSFLVDEEGGEISSPGFTPDNWYPLTVPSTVLAALVSNGVYPDPYVGMNNMKIPDASDEFNERYDLGKHTHLPHGRNPWTDPYWFWTRFRLSEDNEANNIWLNFEGINYRAEVWLNGHLVADSSEVVGMFGNWFFDITPSANTGGVNTLAVKIYPLDYPGLPSEPQLKAFGPFGPNAGPTGDIGKNVTMHCSVGWDWIPAVRDRNMGIWQDVYISTTGAVDLREPHVVSDLPLPDLNEADLEIAVEIVNLTASSQRATLVAEIRPENFTGKEIVLHERVELSPYQVKRIRLDKDSHSELVVKDPKLWWPNGLGAQNLYEVVLRLEIDGMLSDVERTTFGIRELTTVVSRVKKWWRREFFINGRKILLKGGAWVPDMMLRRDPERLYQELRYSKQANLNMVRIWGGGTTPPEEFFTYCDRFGLLVWHDFWITGDCQGTWDKGSKDYPYDEDSFLNAARDVVKKLRNHPSVLVWTAGNEGYPRKEIYVPLRNEILAKLDGTRPFIPSSGYRPPPGDWGKAWPDNKEAGTYSGGPYHWVDPRTYYEKVDDGKDWLFKNEVGIPSLPTVESLRKFIPDLTPHPDVNFPLNHTWGYHDACEGNGKYSLYDKAIRQRYGEPENLEDYIQKGQLVNAENYRAIFESVNEAMNRVGGVLLWKTNSAWPSVMWQLYDWYLSPNAGFYYVRKACEPLHIQLNIDDFDVWVINNRLHPEGKLLAEARVYSDKMDRLWDKDVPVTIGPGRSQKLFKIRVPGKFIRDVYFVELLLRKNGRTISENFYWLSNDNDFTSLSLLPEVKLDVEIGPIKTDEQTIYGIRLVNPSGDLAFFVRASLQKGESDEEILPSFWSDNYFSILPGETKKLTVELQESDLSGIDVYLKLSGWNIVDQLIRAEPSPTRPIEE